jgi:nicotinamidase/pyrazinamidase
VVNTGDWHNYDSEEISENPDFMDTFPLHCLKNTKDAKFIPETNPENPYIIDWAQEKPRAEEFINKRNIVLYKDKFDIFTGNPHAEYVLNAINPKEAIVYGVATNVCVNYAVKGLLERNVDVYVVKDAIKELPSLPVEETLKEWKDKGAKFITTKQVLEERI